MSETLLEVKDLVVSFHTYAGKVQAVRGVSFSMDKGEILAVVGESGCGKSVTAKTIMRLNPTPPAEIEGGQILFEGKDLTKLKEREMHKLRGKKIGMIFQDPMTSLDPTKKISYQIIEAIRRHERVSYKEAYERSVKMLELVGINNPVERMKQYPHEFSGGMRQRAMIAMSLVCHPELLIADEPTTALDVTIQAKILELIRRIQKERGISVIYITHDLGVVAKVADYVDVMYAGKIVETGTIDEIFYDPRHPYTWGLLSAMPDLDTADERLYTIPGSPPNLLHEKPGDAFAARNRFALNIDEEIDPPMFKVTDTHYAATWLLDPRAPKVDMPPELRARVERMKDEARKVAAKEVV